MPPGVSPVEHLGDMHATLAHNPVLGITQATIEQTGSSDPFDLMIHELIQSQDLDKAVVGKIKNRLGSYGLYSIRDLFVVGRKTIGDIDSLGKGTLRVLERATRTALPDRQWPDSSSATEVASYTPNLYYVNSLAVAPERNLQISVGDMLRQDQKEFVDTYAGTGEGYISDKIYREERRYFNSIYSAAVHYAVEFKRAKRGLPPE